MCANRATLKQTTCKVFALDAKLPPEFAELNGSADATAERESDQAAKWHHAQSNG